jgi:hypothetical protein
MGSGVRRVVLLTLGWEDLPLSVSVHGVETVEPIRRLKAIAAERGFRLVPGHDPVVWPALTEELARRFA